MFKHRKNDWIFCIALTLFLIPSSAARADDYPHSYQYSHDPKNARIGLNLHLNCDVWAVMPNSPAAKAGLKKGDKIVALKAKWIRGTRLINLKKFKSYMKQVKAGDHFILVISRGEYLYEVPITVAKRSKKRTRLY